MRRAWRHVWQEALPPAPCDILDVGTGTGQVALLLAELGHHVTGTDLSQGMLELARTKARGMTPPPTFLTDDAIEPDFAPSSFDAVTARYLLWTLHTPDLALQNWRRLLRPGGRLVVVDSTWFPHGVHSPEATSEAPSAFQRSYAPSVVERLPLAEAATIADTVELIEAAGYRDLRLTPLHTIEALDRAQQDDLEHTVRTQYSITART
ncbi:MAG: class I SAM-dependent methyltransferase [Nitriliruptoraceae bacterium]